MNEFWDYIISKIERNEIKEINVHRVIRKISPGDLVKTSMRKPELGNSQVMDDGVLKTPPPAGRTHKSAHTTASRMSLHSKRSRQYSVEDGNVSQTRSGF